VGTACDHSGLQAPNVLSSDKKDDASCDLELSNLELDIVAKYRPGLNLGDTRRWQSPERLAGHPSTVVVILMLSV
jgi:hypothetical protein